MSKRKIMSLESLPNELLLDIFNEAIFSGSPLIDQIRQWFWIVGICKRLRTLVMCHIPSVYSCVAIEHREKKMKSRLKNSLVGGMSALWQTECLHIVSSRLPIESRKRMARDIHDTACNHLFTYQLIGNSRPRCLGCKQNVTKNREIILQYSKND